MSEYQRLPLKINHGYMDWYDWSNAVWGTKWNAVEAKYCGEGEYWFETAWCEPRPVIEALSKKFPHATFDLMYSYEMDDYFGDLEIKNGVVVDNGGYFI